MIEKGKHDDVEYFVLMLDELKRNKEIGLASDTRVTFVTNLGYITGDIIKRSDEQPETGDAKHVFINTFYKTLKKEKENTENWEDAPSIGLVDVNIQPFYGQSNHLDFFLLYTDQIVGLTYGSSHLS